MKTSLQPPRGSFSDTWRLFAGGTQWWIAPLWFLPTLMLLLPAGTPGSYFVAAGVTAAIWFGGTTIGLESLAWERLAFLSLVPQSVDAKWLVLAPPCVGAVVVAAVTAVFGQLPAVSGLLFLGCALWTIGAVRWLKALPPLLALPVLAAFPLFAAAPLAAGAAFGVGGWGAAAAAAVALGLGALAFQPAVRFDSASTAPLASGQAREPIVARVRRGAASRAGHERAAWLAAAVRFLLVCTAQLRRFTLVVSLFITATAMTLPLPGSALFLLVLFVPSSTVGQIFSWEASEFLRPLPFSRRQRLVSGALIPLLLTLAAPVAMMTYVDLDWINAGGLHLTRGPHNHASTLWYLREALGATFLPEQWPAGGLSPEMWTRLRPLLWLDLLRIAAILVAALFGGSVVRTRPERLTAALGPLVFKLSAFFMAMRLMFGQSAGRPVPPLWLAVLLAAAALAHFWWRLRVANAPADGAPPATGSSTAG